MVVTPKYELVITFPKVQYEVVQLEARRGLGITASKRTSLEKALQMAECLGVDEETLEATKKCYEVAVVALKTPREGVDNSPCVTISLGSIYRNRKELEDCGLTEDESRCAG
jgi:hypothetical protein